MCYNSFRESGTILSCPANHARPPPSPSNPSVRQQSCSLVVPPYRYVAPTYLLCLSLLRKHRGCGGILPILVHPERYERRELIPFLDHSHSRSFFSCTHKMQISQLFSFHIHANWWGCLLSELTNRCIIPPRERPPQRSRMPRPGLSHRKRNHHSRILPALLERSLQRLHPAAESRSGHASRRGRRPPGLAFSGRTILGPFRQRLGQPRHQVPTPPPGSFHLLPPRDRNPLRFPASRRPESPPPS